MSFLKNVLNQALESGFVDSGAEFGDTIVAHDEINGDKVDSRAVSLKIALKNGAREWSTLTPEELILLAKLAREEEQARIESERRAMEAKAAAKAAAKPAAKPAAKDRYQHSIELGASKIELSRQLISLQAQVSDLQGEILELANRSESTIRILKQLADSLGLYE